MNAALRQQIKQAIDARKRERLHASRRLNVTPHAIWKRQYRQKKRRA